MREADSAELALSLSKEAGLSIGDTLLRPRPFGKRYCRGRIRRGGSLAGGLRWQAPRASRQFYARADRREPHRYGIAQGFAATCAHPFAKHRRVLADRFRKQQRNLFKQTTDSSSR